jgi:hypothetical protein
LKGYSTTESKSEYGGVSQRWILVSEEGLNQTSKKLDKKRLRKSSENAIKSYRFQQDKILFVADAITAAEKLSAKMMVRTRIFKHGKTTLCQTGNQRPDAIPTSLLVIGLPQR